MKFYGQFEVPVDRFIFERYFPDPDIKGVFIECGAFDGQTECSCRFFEETMGWQGYNLEPVPWIYDKLVVNRPNSKNINVGMSDKTGVLNFQSVIHPVYGRDTTIGSVDHDPVFKEALIAGGCTFEEIKIRAISWQELISTQKITDVDLMVLDVEGHELSVLSGMRNSPVLPHVMCIEFGHVGFDQLRIVMGELGYQYDIHSFANAYFVRTDMIPLMAFRRLAGNSGTQHQVEQLSAEIADKQIEIDRLNNEAKWLKEREKELVELVETMTNSRGWRALEVLRNLRHLKRTNRKPDVIGTSLHATNDSSSERVRTDPATPSHGINTTPESVAKGLQERVRKLEEQVELVETHHIRGFWHTLDKIDDLALPSRQLKCLVCDHDDFRDGFEILRSECIFNGGRLERYRCPNCDCVFGGQKFLDLDEAMTDLDYRLLYSRYREGNTGENEKRTFQSLRPVRGATYVNWGAGVWNDTTQVLRADGYDVWSFEPNAPSEAPFVKIDRSDLGSDLAGIFSNNVIEHFKEPIVQFREFQRVLAPGGKMAHSSPCYEYLYPITRFHTIFLLGRSPDILAERTGFRITDRVKDGEYNNVVFEKI
ncbi:MULTISPECIES: FkbM family methyltransferase [unclassified Mesorhizobium]|uniref:FkbM family methyltransferase n=1 Tax=unclassified Mesorhizobium TaxID=325217 RepID=UPI00112B7939|nr:MULTISPECIES: FkbM family methyltransferase [unclassified Mesorhizobium]MBZ9921394.1 FkbM family methyltransferase [Mesorhizobium sp. BR1-1-7]MBZ9970361.1 FkbM family methyltransferase [Mesorhizobium sp. BR1-1-12]MBZ9981311.1 FkbM family methyltransferase [Mesorhizobium sp. BR-1-1-8]TPL33705.1 FkbM family methyltransferase [Mesorhizobium sp. B2-4-8]TPL62486.1 FkbM family methyltransferase [Mesorhizobium sp. B2-4-1]